MTIEKTTTGPRNDLPGTARPTASDRPVRAQPTRSPHLITTGTDRRAVSVGVTADASATVVELTVHGQWSPDVGSQVMTILNGCLAGPTSVIVVDLRGLSDLHGVSRPFWEAAARTACLRPTPAHLVLCLPALTMLDYRLRHGDGPLLQIFATMQEARMTVAGRLSRGWRLQAQLDPHPRSVPTARKFVAQACHRWQLPHLQHDACLIISELVSNAVQHAETDLVVTASFSGDCLHLAVRDGDTRYPRLHRPVRDREQFELGERGRGMHLVHAVAAGWGAVPARGGKVVWATVSPDAP